MARTKTKLTGAVMVVAKAAVVAVMMLAGSAVADIDNAYVSDEEVEASFTVAFTDPDQIFRQRERERRVRERREREQTAAVDTSAVHADRRGPYVPGTILLQTRWSQNPPFQNLLPRDRNGTRPYTFCTPVAISQIMRYHEWPKIISGNIPGYAMSRDSTIVPEIIREDFSYDWANMKNIYRRDAQGDTADAVAVLLRHVGVARRLGRRGASADGIMPAHFDYDNEVKRIWRNGTLRRPEGIAQDSILPYIWKDIMRLQIDSLLPVFYYADGDGGGDHAFVLDGYNNEGRFHFNAGWGGRGDGWHTADSVINFNGNPRMTINIMPNDDRIKTPALMLFGRNLRARNLSGNYGEIVSVNNGELFFVNPTIYNIGTATSPAGRVLGVALYISDNQFVIIGETTLDETLTFTRAREPVSNPRQKREDFNLEISSTVPANIPQGNYVLRAVMKNANGEWEVLGTVNHYVNEMTVCVGGSICTAAPRPQPVAQNAARDTVVLVSTSAPTVTSSSPTTTQPARLITSASTSINIVGTWSNARNSQRYEFRANGMGVWRVGGRPHNFTYTVTPPNIVLTLQAAGGGSITRTFSHTGGNTFVNDDNETFTRR